MRWRAYQTLYSLYLGTTRSGRSEEGRLHQLQEHVGQDFLTHRPEINQPLLLLSSRNNEEGVEEVNKAVPVDCKEGELVDPLSVVPCKCVKDIAGSPSGLGPGSDGKVGGGTHQANSGIGRLISPRTRSPLL